MATPDGTHAMRLRMLRSTAAQSVGNVAVALISVTALHLATADLGPRSYGHLVTVISFVTLFTLFTDLGLNSLATRDLARHPERAEEIIGDNLGLRCALALVLVPCIGGLGLLVYPHDRGTVGLGIFVMALDLVLNAAQTTVLTHYSAKVRNDVAAAVLLADKVLYLLLVVGAVALGAPVLAFVGAYVAADVLGAGLAWWLVRREVAVRPRVHRAAWAAIVRRSSSMGLLTIIASLYLWNGIIFVSVLEPPAQVAFYGVDFSFLTVLTFLPTYFMTAVMPSLATTTDPAAQRDSVQKAVELVSVVAVPIAVGGVLLRSQLVTAIAGPRFGPAASPFALMVVAVAFSFLNNVFGFSAIALGRQGSLVKVQLPMLAVDVAANASLVAAFGIRGAGAAVLACEAATCVGLYLALSRMTGLRLQAGFLWRPLAAAVPMAVVGATAAGAWHVGPPLLRPVIGVALLGTVYLVGLVAVRGVPPVLQDMITTATGRRLPA